MGGLPLERRLQDINKGIASYEVARRVITGFALQSIESLYDHFQPERDELLRLGKNKWLGARGLSSCPDWDERHTCYAAIAWRVEQIYLLLEKGVPDSSVRRGLSKAAARATDDLLSAFLPTLRRLDLGGRRTDDIWYHDFALRAACPDSELVHGRLITGICCLSVGQVLSICQDLIREAGAPPFSNDELTSSYDGERIHTYLSKARLKANRIDDERKPMPLRPVLVTPFAALWGTGALQDERLADEPVPPTELNLRLAALKRRTLLKRRTQ